MTELVHIPSNPDDTVTLAVYDFRDPKQRDPFSGMPALFDDDVTDIKFTECHFEANPEYPGIIIAEDGRPVVEVDNI